MAITRERGGHVRPQFYARPSPNEQCHILLAGVVDTIAIALIGGFWGGLGGSFVSLDWPPGAPFMLVTNGISIALLTAGCVNGILLAGRCRSREASLRAESEHLLQRGGMDALRNRRATLTADGNYVTKYLILPLTIQGIFMLSINANASVFAPFTSIQATAVSGMLSAASMTAMICGMTYANAPGEYYRGLTLDGQMPDSTIPLLEADTHRRRLVVGAEMRETTLRVIRGGRDSETLCMRISHFALPILFVAGPVAVTAALYAQYLQRIARNPEIELRDIWLVDPPSLLAVQGLPIVTLGALMLARGCHPRWVRADDRAYDEIALSRGTSPLVEILPRARTLKKCNQLIACGFLPLISVAAMLVGLSPYWNSTITLQEVLKMGLGCLSLIFLLNLLAVRLEARMNRWVPLAREEDRYLVGEPPVRHTV